MQCRLTNPAIVIYLITSKNVQLHACARFLVLTSISRKKNVTTVFAKQPCNCQLFPWVDKNTISNCLTFKYSTLNNFQLVSCAVWYTETWLLFNLKRTSRSWPTMCKHQLTVCFAGRIWITSAAQCQSYICLTAWMPDSTDSEHTGTRWCTLLSASITY